MNAEHIAKQAFYSEWAVLRRLVPNAFNLSSARVGKEDFGKDELLNNVFDFPAVQRLVNDDLSGGGRPELIRRRYHFNNLRFIGRAYAQELFAISHEGADISENSLRETLKVMKSRWNCPIYTCQRGD